MPNDLLQAIEIGRKNSAETLARRAAARVTRANALAAHPAPVALGVLRPALAAAAPQARQTAGFLVAMGDSWFDYPVYDVVKQLEDLYGYDVQSAAHRGDPIEAMAYGKGQLDQLARYFEKVTDSGGVPKAVLISGGGDDIAGTEFGMLLNSAASGTISGWNNEIIDGLINQRLLNAYVTSIEGINGLANTYAKKLLPILFHGYDYPVPDGRGFLGGWGPLPGPWLKPGFDEKLFDVPLNNVGMMQDLIDRFNTMLSDLAANPIYTNLHFVDLRNTLSTDPNTYKNWWGNELHPTEDGFKAVTAKFAAVLSAL